MAEPGKDEDDDDLEDDDVFEIEVEDEIFERLKPPGFGDVRGLRPALDWQALEPSLKRRPSAASAIEVSYFLDQEFDERWSIAVGKRKRNAGPAGGLGAELGALAPAKPSTLLPALSGAELELMSLIQNLRDREYYGYSTKAWFSTRSFELLFPRLVASGRCHLLPRVRTGDLAKAWHLFCEGAGPKQLSGKTMPQGYAALLAVPRLVVDDQGAWELELQLTERVEPVERVRRVEPVGRVEPVAPGAKNAPAALYEARAALVRGDERRTLQQLRLAQRNGTLLFSDGGVGRCSTKDAHWVGSLRDEALTDRLLVPQAQLSAFLELGFGSSGVSRLVLPEHFERVTGVPGRPVLQLDAPRGRSVTGQVFFEYGATRVSVRQKSRLVLLSAEQALQRDAQLEERALATLREAGFDGAVLGGRSSANSDVKVASVGLLPALRAALDGGFQVFAEGKRYRTLSRFDIQVESGLDWFEVRGGAHFGDAVIPLPALLRQARSGGMVELGDGSCGVLPADWLERWGGLSDLSSKKDTALRFSARQLGIAEALLGALGEEVELPGLAQLRERVSRFYEVTPLEPPATFRGALRPYQAHGVSWLGALSELGIGACLADDMGLGKTIQLLGHFARIYARSPHAKGTKGAKGTKDTKRAKDTKGAKDTKRAPSLIVMPRTLLANWSAEAARFAPELRVHTHWGPDRGDVESAFRDVDLVFTTYGTLRLDIAALAQLDLHTVALDEAQAIKNGSSATAKCARMLRASHRIALSGTPIENHLGELWSLFEFLNPGMLAELPSLGKALNSGQASGETLQLIQRVLRPFVLRRTKQEVAKDLPERSEQTLYVDLEPEERKHYDQLLKFYQASITKQGLTDPAASTPHVLEALLRLRQAACHPGLIDAKRAGERSSKLELLIEQLKDLTQEGHKALVFSQFTSLLGILRTRLEEEQISFEYLDGKTRDREAPVARFQQDPALSVFLISLKAGGVGLNLTAADYVFILDPWWNPAVEAQAVDRAHRIGQTRPVIAYRLLARNTVEERVAELQNQKRQLVAAVMGDASAFTGKLTRGDLESLLGLGGG